MKCQHCRRDLSPSSKFCGGCGKPVEIDNRKIKKCKKCSSLVNLTQKYCSNCGNEVSVETFMCKGIKDGRICNEILTFDVSFCCKCGTASEASLDVLDGERRSEPTIVNTVNIETVLKEDDKNGKSVVFELSEETTVITEISAQEESEAPTSTQKQGLAVVCCHSKFNHETHILRPRENAWDDLDMMKNIWSLYGCEVMDFYDPKTKVYEENLIAEIEEKLKEMKRIDYFVFVLSTHGEERVEGDIGSDDGKTIQHYFFTKDGQYNTQQLMDRISNIEKLQDKLKMFIIQACRSRMEGENEDHGFEIDVNELKKDSQEIPDQNKSTGLNLADARGYMPPPDEEEIELTPGTHCMQEGLQATTLTIDNNTSSNMSVEIPINIEDITKGTAEMKLNGQAMKGQISVDKSQVEDLPPLEVVPHCDDCLVIFASMAGKYAYKKVHSEDSGGWLIKSLHDKLVMHEAGKHVYLLDLITEVNQEVGRRETVVHRRNLDIKTPIGTGLEKEGLVEIMKDHLCSLQNAVLEQLVMVDVKTKLKKLQNEIDLLSIEIYKDSQSKESLLMILNGVLDDLTRNITEEIEWETLKAQSCFFHNLAFDENELYLTKMK